MPRRQSCDGTCTVHPKTRRYSVDSDTRDADIATNNKSVSVPYSAMPRIDIERVNAIRDFTAHRAASRHLSQLGETDSLPDDIVMESQMLTNVFALDRSPYHVFADSFRCLMCDGVFNTIECIAEVWPCGMPVNHPDNSGSLTISIGQGLQALFCISCHCRRVNSKTLSTKNPILMTTELSYHFPLQHDAKCDYCKNPLNPPVSVIRFVKEGGETAYEAVYLHTECCKIYIPFNRQYVKCFPDGTRKFKFNGT